MNRIEVKDSPPAEPLVLKYHHIDTLVCKPNCKVEREPIDGDLAGFIRIPAPHPANVIIENGY